MGRIVQERLCFMLEVKISWWYFKPLICHSINQTMVLIMVIQLLNLRWRNQSLLLHAKIICDHLWRHSYTFIIKVWCTALLLLPLAEAEQTHWNPKTLVFSPSSALEIQELPLTDSSEESKTKLLHSSSCSRHGHCGIFCLFRYLSQTDLHLLD